ncbi:hypothetical protein BRETT_003863 [Brettanomyces bruxellensis]|uniref:Mog1p/PsbP-like protein n=1 Tax=Dekkera bruxellensis TaxID=5007 RepID=A0A871RAT8_DEKBR|nr:uncharacterized protein BRETT_003863 [Brettanomyces bruxellensis]QOU19711.1 hypothetical protein BRETT_003863 [Brettanomyces bruxellensis]
MNFQRTDLYGGAITAQIPRDLIDASKFRQIPDTQEVYVCRDSTILNENDALIIDLMERADVKDSDALRYHLKEICRLNGVEKDDSVILEEAHDLKVVNLPDSYCDIVTSGENVKKWGRDDVHLVLILAIVRLLRVKTDLLISYNVPFHKPDEMEDLKKMLSGNNSTAGKAKQRIDVGRRVVAKVLDSLKIENWALFKN